MYILSEPDVTQNQLKSPRRTVYREPRWSNLLIPGKAGKKQINNLNITIFKEEVGPLSWSNWNLEMLVFCGGRKTGNPIKWQYNLLWKNCK